MSLALSSLAIKPPVMSAQERPARSQIVEDLYDTQLLDADGGWAVGAFGAIYHTSDGGRHWRLQHVPTTQDLYSLSFSDERNGWAVGRSGTIIHTTDGGARWTPQQSGTTKHLFKVCFIDSREGWVVGDWGVVLQTVDGGDTWRDRSLREDEVLYAVDFADRHVGWIVGERGSIRHSVDGGETWVKQTAAAQKTLFGVAAVSREKAWAVGIDGLVLRTRDGGATWQIQRGAGRMASLEKLAPEELLNNPGLYDIKIRGGKGYVVGDVGNLLVSEDAGETWTRTLLPPEWRLSWLRGLSVLPSGAGIVVGASGLTFTVNGHEMHFSQDSAPPPAETPLR
jgi:photosystem II stability/assembly factor-like uncharacterized protein